MTLRFTELPVFVEQSAYDEAIRFMSDKLMNTGLVKCVYQVGGVSSPGISDLDLFVVFKNGVTFTDNPVATLEFPYKYLFIHKLFGTSERLAPVMERFTFFGKYNYIAGEQIDLLSNLPSTEDINILKPQIAIEYLIKAYVAICTGLEFQTIKLRSFLLHAKAVQYDINFLGVKNEKLLNCINRIIEIRNTWFHKQPNDSQLRELINDYKENLLIYLHDCIAKYQFYLPAPANKQIANRITLKNGNEIKVIRNGINLPAFLTSSSKTLFKINNRLNNFTVEIPTESENIPPIIKDRFKELRNAFEFNKANLPYFICTGHGLDIFRTNEH